MNLLGAREAIPQLLDLFGQFDVHATWATVGMLGFESKLELLENLPVLHPNYSNLTLSPYTKLHALGEDEKQDPIHFASSIIREIATTPNQELASHTFSHYYCLEAGQSIEEFEEDLVASINKVNSYGHSCHTLVFPRNQINESYLHICKQYGITNYRGTEKNWLYKACSSNSEGLFKRLLRFTDSYINLTGHHTYPIAKVDCNPIIDLPASRFLRPYPKRLKALEFLRLKRIKNSMSYAARNGEVYHLWWHPHNFGKHTEENIRFLTEILKWMETLRNDYGFRSLTMNETSSYVIDLNREMENKLSEKKSLHTCKG